MEKKDHYRELRMYGDERIAEPLRYREKVKGRCKTESRFMAGMLTGALLMLVMLFFAPWLVIEILAGCFSQMLE
ncbi:hypothetical protein [Escherichia coli]|uniref:Uncharacterized protein n=1 Tax=Escherichia coli TaxID=562 RepID=A0AAJ3CZL7_ECOLX|nr:hypothetical protein [Escherichia coli]EFD9231876.1 hypothetical protein [Escherichia coli]EIQ2116595.1 hypothetical protein [Escherichia coli]ELH8646979.1 hypothetical protein [Escherichia coli]MBS9194829.1 hypothetical protein [Escherichia coli]MUM75067.1 hypothetical protein [Escherichia coli]